MITIRNKDNKSKAARGAWRIKKGILQEAQRVPAPLNCFPENNDSKDKDNRPGVH